MGVVPCFRGPAIRFRCRPRLLLVASAILFWLLAGFNRIHAEPTPEASSPEPDAPAAPQVSEQPAARTSYLMMGLLAHDPGGLWSRAKSEAGADFNIEILFAQPARTFWRGMISPSAGLTLNSQGDTAKVYGGALYELQNQDGVFVNAGLGLALHNGRLRTTDPQRKQLGSRLLFHIPIEAGFTFGNQKRLSLFFDHISNGYSFHPNEGLDTIGFRFGVPF